MIKIINVIKKISELQALTALFIEIKLSVSN
jgi:hypothetical protein